nr:hypothetical protein Iba_chr04aCG12890 [Ipomoea batatas]
MGRALSLGFAVSWVWMNIGQFTNLVQDGLRQGTPRKGSADDNWFNFTFFTLDACFLSHSLRPRREISIDFTFTTSGATFLSHSSEAEPSFLFLTYLVLRSDDSSIYLRVDMQTNPLDVRAGVKIMSSSFLLEDMLPGKKLATSSK